MKRIDWTLLGAWTAVLGFCGSFWAVFIYIILHF